MRKIARFRAAGVALASVSIIAFAQFPVPGTQAVPLRGVHVGVELAANPIDIGFAPLETLGPLTLGDEVDEVLHSVYGAAAADLLPDIGDPANAGAAGDFDPMSLLMVPLVAFAFVLAAVPLAFTVAGSLFAVLVNQLGSGFGLGDIPAGAAEATVLDPDTLSASLLSDPDLPNAFANVGDITSSLAGGLSSAAGALMTETLADLGLAF